MNPSLCGLFHVKPGKPVPSWDTAAADLAEDIDQGIAADLTDYPAELQDIQDTLGRLEDGLREYQHAAEPAVRSAANAALAATNQAWMALDDLSDAYAPIALLLAGVRDAIYKLQQADEVWADD